MKYVLTSQNRKKHQRRANKIIREMQQIVNDVPGWSGRLVIQQHHSEFISSEDWGMLTSLVFLYDKKTKFSSYVTLNTSSCFSLSKLAWEVNTFINYCENLEREILQGVTQRCQYKNL